MSRNVELESAIKYTISNPTRYNGFLRVAANNFRLSTANQLFVYYQKEDADIVLDAGRWEKLFGRIVADNAQKIRIVQTGKTGKPQWTTYYDIADTIVTDDSKPVIRATVAQDVSMEQIREIAEKKMLLASSQIEDYMAANGIIVLRILIILFGFLFFWFSSYLFPNGNAYLCTPIGASTEIAADHYVTLNSWEYSKNQKEMIVELLCNNKSFDGNNEYHFEAYMRNSSA